MKMYVICCNDYPHQVLPQNTSKDQANELLEQYNALKQHRIYYHMHAIDVSLALRKVN